MSDLRATMREMIQSRVFLRATEHRRIITPHGSPSAWTFDFRAVALDPEWLDAYANVFWERFGSHAPFQVGGMETAAIPLVTAIVTRGRERGTPVSGFYIRKSRDRDGLMKRIEGTLSDAPIILVDDLMNTGGSFEKQFKVLDDLGKRISDIFVALAFRAHDAYAFALQRNIRVHHIFTLEDFGLPLQTTSSPDIPQELFDTVWKFSSIQPSFEWVLQKSAPTIDRTRIYFGTDAGIFYALEQSSGEIAWQFSIQAHPRGKGIFSSPALNNGIVYFGAYDGTVYALNAATGNLAWKYSDADWVGSSPALAPDRGLAYIGLEFGLFRKRGGIVALDLKTGAPQWQDRTPALTHGSPLYIKEEGLVVIGSNDGVVYAYGATNGERRWTYTTQSDIKTRPAYDPVRRLVLVPSMDGTLYALEATSGQARWAYQTGAGIYSNPLIDGDFVHVASLDKYLYTIDLRSGKRLSRFETGGRIFASPVIADNSLWIGSNDGRLYELDSTRRLRGFHQFSERIVNAIAHNAKTQLFFVPTVGNELYCLRRKSKAVE